MISGERELRQLYPDLDEDQYQPAGIDLTLGQVSKLKYTDGVIYGLLKNAKVLPEQELLETNKVHIGGMVKNVFNLMPHECYIATTQEKIKIDEHSGQFYLPRSSLLRAGIDVRTAFGDPGFHGHLSFLLVNHTNNIFVIERGVRFAQLIDIEALHVDNKYDGDYNED